VRVLSTCGYGIQAACGCRANQLVWIGIEGLSLCVIPLDISWFAHAVGVTNWSAHAASFRCCPPAPTAASAHARGAGTVRAG
jgi:hypothetical protein